MRTRTPLLGLEVLTLSLIANPLAWAGGIEHYCDNGVERVEFWPASRFPLTWEVWLQGPNGNESVVPGYPPFNCTTAPWDQRPGMQSLILGTKAWGMAAMPPLLSIGSPGSPPQVPVKATSFLMSNTPALQFFNTPCPPHSGQPGGIGPNTTNSIVFLQNLGCPNDPNVQGPLGGLSQFVISLAAVSRVEATGEILDADIFFNAARPSSGQPMYYGWVERNDSLQEALVSETAPSESFVDLQGIVTHEVGHLAGLAHSLIDSTASPEGSLFPTMWFYGGTNAPFSAVVRPPTAPGICLGTSQSVSGIITGASASTLEPDDISAIGAAYPSSRFYSDLGRIKGTVYRMSGVNEIESSGAIVVAIPIGDPDRHRIATFSYGGGDYVLEGLPPGKYYVFVEPLDVGQPGYFGAYGSDTTFPGYVWGGPVIGSTSCLPAGSPPGNAEWAGFSQEFYNSLDTYSNEPSQLADAIKVKAGETIESIDLRVAGLGLVLRVAPALFTPASARGLVLTSGAATSVVFYVTGAPNMCFDLCFGTDRILELRNDQLWQIPLNGSGSLFTISGTLDTSGQWSSQPPINIAAQFSPPDTVACRNIFAQVVTHGFPPQCNGLEGVSNPVNIWVRR